MAGLRSAIFLSGQEKHNPSVIGQYVIGRLREGGRPLRTSFRTLPLFAQVTVMIPLILQNGLPAENQIQSTTLNARLGEPWSIWVRPPGPAHQSSDQEDRDSPETELSR